MATFSLLSVLTVHTGHAQAAPAAPAYAVTTVPLLPGYNVITLTALNNAGDVVGVASNTTGSPAAHTFLYQRGKVRDLGALGTPIAVNVFGAILTSSDLYQGGRLVASAPIGSFFTGLNDIGQIIGSGNPASFASFFQPTSGFLRQPNGTIVPLTFQGAPVYPVAINNVGQIVADYTTPNTFTGAASVTGPMHRVVLFRAGGGKNGVDIGTLGFWTFGAGINIWGKVVGNSQVLYNSSDIGATSSVYEAPVGAVIYSGGSLTSFESLFGFDAIGEATSINAFGTIIGTAATTLGVGSGRPISTRGKAIHGCQKPRPISGRSPNRQPTPFDSF